MNMVQLRSASNTRITPESARDPSGQRTKGSPTTAASNGHALSALKSFFIGSQLKPPSPPRTSRGIGEDRRKTELVPQIKPGLNGVNKKPPPYFRTEAGLKRLPRRKRPLRPSPGMIKSARQGILSKFLRSGNILSASEFGDMVDPHTAKLDLSAAYDFETEHLSDEEEQMDEDKKTASNLFYVSVNADELPSYHFWQGEDDVNPMEHQKELNWDNYFSTNPSKTQLRVLENDELRREQEQNEAQNAAATGNDSTGVRNAWMPGGEYYRQVNPKNGPRICVMEAVEPAWERKGTIAGIPYSSSRQSTVDDSRQTGPQPGDEEWEVVEAGFEAELTQKGFHFFMEIYKKENPAKYEALKYGPKSPIFRPTGGDDPDTRLFNDVVKTAVPTVAFKLTQQHFGRPVSPLNDQEPLIRGRDPKHWTRDAKSLEDAEVSYGELVMHKEEELEFLDFYNQKAYGDIMIRSKYKMIFVALDFS